MTWLAQTDFTDLLKLGAGGVTVTGLLVLILWLFLTERIIPGTLYRAEREARIKAEDRERAALTRVDRAIDAVQKTLPKQGDAP